MVGCVCNEEDTNIKWTWLCEGVPKVILLWCGMGLQLHPVATLASLGNSLTEPGPLDVGVLLVADTPNHPVVIHGVDNGGLVLGSLGSLDSLQEERIFIAGLLG